MIEYIIIGVATVLLTIIAIIVSKRNSDGYGKDSSIPTNEYRGIQGEITVNNYLSRLIQKDEYLLNNILLPLRNGHKTEIDSILITRKGIFCIEVKNWVGHISGDDYSEFWTQKYDDLYMIDKQHRNPVKQNENHCAVLEKKLNNEFSVKNVVIFPKIEDRTNLYSNSTYELNDFIKFYNNLPDNEIYPENLEEIADKLKCYQASKEEMEVHKQQVRNAYKNKQ